MKLAMIVLSLVLSTGTARAACSDLAAVATVRAEAEGQCPCASASGRRPYVQCVARVAKTAAKAGSLPKSCRGAVIKCAKQSTCGQPGFVTCSRTTAKGKSTCSVKSSATACRPPKGGSMCVGDATSCCDESCLPATTTTMPGGVTTTTALGGAQTRTVMVGGGGGFSFSPATLTIHVGDTVRWHTMDVQRHNVVSSTPGQQFRSPDVSSANVPNVLPDSYERTFTVDGHVDYLCEYHDGMVATFDVVPANQTIPDGGM